MNRRRRSACDDPRAHASARPDLRGDRRARTALPPGDHRSLHHDPAVGDGAGAGPRHRDGTLVLARRLLHARQSRSGDRPVGIRRLSDRACGARRSAAPPRARSGLHVLLFGADIRALPAADRVLRHRPGFAHRDGSIVRDRRHDRRHRDGNRPHSASSAEGRPRIAAGTGPHRIADEVAGRVAASDERAAARGRL